MANVKGGRYVKSLYFPIRNPDTNEKHYPSSNGNWRFNEETIDELLKNNEIYFGKDGDGRPKLKRFLCDVQDGVPYNTIWSDDVPLGVTGTREISKLFGTIEVFDTVKPERVMSEIINLATSEHDIVIDFCLGSGTTAAVAHKMNRQYIGIEQMDYIEPVAVERLKKVIAGEQGGISKAVDWKGGGDFIYLELAKWNQTAKEKINACESFNELETFFDQMYEKYFLCYNLKLKEFKEKVLQEAEFQKLSLDEQKRMFLTMLDLNQMYVNKSEMADAKYAISKEDQKLTAEFYGED